MSEYVIYNRQGAVNENTSATFRESVKKIIKSEENISGDITIEKIGISEISNSKFEIHVEYDLDGKLMEIDLPFEKCKDLSACKNAKKALDKINGLDTKKMDLKNLITLFMCMVCESEEERAKTLQQVSNQMGIASLNLALSKREIDRDAAEMQYSSSKLEAWGTIAKSGVQLVAVGVSAAVGPSKGDQNNLNQNNTAKDSAELQQKLNDNNNSLQNKECNLKEFDADASKRKEIISKTEDKTTKELLTERQQILKDAETKSFELVKEGDVCKKFKVTVNDKNFNISNDKNESLVNTDNNGIRTYTSDKFFEKGKDGSFITGENGKLVKSNFYENAESNIRVYAAKIDIANNNVRMAQGIGEAIGGIVEGGFKLGAAGEKYDADIAKADKEYLDASMNLINNLWNNYRQNFSAALNRVDKTASILKESIDALLQTNMQISRNI